MWRWILERLDEQFPAFDVDRWWGIDDPFERMIGSVLVQNTTWSNAAKALAGLRERSWLTPQALGSLSADDLIPAIRSAGFQQAKSRTILRLVHWLMQHGGVGGIIERQATTEQLRSELLSLKGIGEETADTILAYSFNRPTISGDAYARRLYQRVSGESLRYKQIRHAILDEIKTWADLARLHGLIVEHGKVICRKRSPRCEGCQLRPRCLFFDHAKRLS
ncbi:MAG: endonuclease [Brevibacillus sp.]|nr:endonuclease [Brevibacillus sp.]